MSQQGEQSILIGVNKESSPSRDLYDAIEKMFNHFNSSLFDNSLPSVVITMQKQKNVMGYFSPFSWVSSQDQKKYHEIAINPEYIATFPLVEVLQTLTHELCHAYQTCFGKPSRTGYHNKEWSEKMLSIGLIPSTTGKPGGKKVGQKMSDYPEPNGRFIKACEELVLQNNAKFPIVAISGVVNSGDSESLDMSNEVVQSILEMPVCEALGIEITITEKKKVKQKTKYSCGKCKVNVWGKNNLNIICADCKTPFVAQDF
jgi:predicted SprT family Zn-dependent metalloprotease